MKAKKVSRKGMPVTKFTQEQTEKLALAIESKSYKNNYRIAEFYAKEFKKPIRNVYAKVQRIINNKTSVAVVAKPAVKKVKETPVAKIEVVQEEVKPLTLPKGMTYQGTAKKVELHADHFRVYF